MDADAELLTAADAGDLEGVAAAIGRGADVNATDRSTRLDALDLASSSVFFGRKNLVAEKLLLAGAQLKGRCRACLLGVGEHDPNATK